MDLTYSNITLLVFVTIFDFILQMMPTKVIVTTVNSSVNRPTTIPRAMLASLEEETKLLFSVELSTVRDGVTYTVFDGVAPKDWVCDAITTVVNVIYMVDVLVMVGSGLGVEAAIRFVYMLYVL